MHNFVILTPLYFVEILLLLQFLCAMCARGVVVFFVKENVFQCSDTVRSSIFLAVSSETTFDFFSGLGVGVFAALLG